jgi:hypothetical protein
VSFQAFEDHKNILIGIWKCLFAQRGDFEVVASADAEDICQSWFHFGVRLAHQNIAMSIKRFEKKNASIEVASEGWEIESIM